MGNTNDRNAGSVVAGFVYQIYYFLYRLLTMGVDETVSLEKFEDVGVETGNERTYYQLKHTCATTHTCRANEEQRCCPLENVKYVD